MKCISCDRFWLNLEKCSRGFQLELFVSVERRGLIFYQIWELDYFGTSFRLYCISRIFGEPAGHIFSFMPQYNFTAVFPCSLLTSYSLFQVRYILTPFLFVVACPSHAYKDYNSARWAALFTVLVPEFSAGALIGFYMSSQQLRVWDHYRWMTLPKCSIRDDGGS